MLRCMSDQCWKPKNLCCMVLITEPAVYMSVRTPLHFISKCPAILYLYSLVCLYIS